MQLLTNLVHDGYASRGALNWGQPDVATQFGEGYAAILLLLFQRDITAGLTAGAVKG